MFLSSFSYEYFLSIEKVLVYTVKANAFMMHQVRSMVGTMLQLASESAPPDMMRELLEAHQRTRVLRTAPADGLYLTGVEYYDE